MTHGVLQDLGISIIVATLVGIVTHRLKQPIIFGYLVTGALIGPEIGLKLVTDPQSIETISEIGLILLLFIIGLEMNPKQLVSSGRQLLVAGLGQYILCAGLGLLAFTLLGFGAEYRLEVLYLSLLCALSSTAIVVKLLYDKSELDTIPGRLTLGVLIIQDIWAILILIFQPDFMNPQLSLLGFAVLKTVVLLAAAILLSRFALWNVFEKISKTPEMVVATSIAWCAFVAGMASYLGLSMEMGALIAGLSVSTFPYSVHVTAQTRPLRDFFVTLFFISLGMKITSPDMETITAALVIVIFIIASRFLTIYPLITFSGGSRRTGFITSVNLSQISEFSLVIASIGVAYGHIEKGIMSLLIYAMTFTSIISSYLIKYNHQLYLLFEKALGAVGIKAVKEDALEKVESKSYPVVILGFHRGAKSLIDELQKKTPAILQEVLVIDFNLEVLNELREKKIAGLFGDISSLETLQHAHIRNARIILSTIPDTLLKGTDNFNIVRNCRAAAPDAHIIATADLAAQAQRLRAAGADDVLLPYALAGEHLCDCVGTLYTMKGLR